MGRDCDAAPSQRSRGIKLAYLGDSKDIVGVPELGLLWCRRSNEVCHEAHQGPAANGDQSALDLALLSLLSGAQAVYYISVRLFVVCLDAQGEGIVVGAGTQQRICQGERDQARERQDEDGEELGLQEGVELLAIDLDCRKTVPRKGLSILVHRMSSRNS